MYLAFPSYNIIQYRSPLETSEIDSSVYFVLLSGGCVIPLLSLDIVRSVKCEVPIIPTKSESLYSRSCCQISMLLGSKISVIAETRGH